MKIHINENDTNTETVITINCKRTDESILKMLAMLRIFDQKITAQKEGETFLLDASEILYIESVDKKTFSYTNHDVYETPFRIYELEERLKDCDFIRISKSAVVNFNQIRSLRQEMGGRMRLTMNNGELIIASRQYVPVIKAKLGLLC